MIFLKTIEHLIFQSTKEGLHNTVVIAVTFSGHGLNDSVFLKFIAVECVLVLPAGKALSASAGAPSAARPSAAGTPAGPPQTAGTQARGCAGGSTCSRTPQKRG